MADFVALLRGINVGGRTLPMAALRELCAGLGWSKVETYIQSGNVLFAAQGEPPALETTLEAAIDRRFGMKVPVIVRSAAQWADYPEGNPFPEAARDAPNRLLLLLSKRPPAPAAEQELAARATAGESVRVVGDALWIWFPAGVGTSKLSPTLIDRLVTSPATGRNYRTVLKLNSMLEARTE